MHRPSRRRTGATILEVALVLTLTAILLGIAIPRVGEVRERAAVRGAVADVVATLSAARQLAVSLGGGISVSVDAATSSVHVIRDRDTMMTRPLGRLFGVSVRGTRDSLAYDARGLGSGAANMTFVIVRGITIDTVVVSRLGRVRW